MDCWDFEIGHYLLKGKNHAVEKGVRLEFFSGKLKRLYLSLNTILQILRDQKAAKKQLAKRRHLIWRMPIVFSVFLDVNLTQISHDWLNSRCDM